MNVVLTELSDIMINNEELIGTTEYLALQTRCRPNRRSYTGLDSGYMHRMIHNSVTHFTKPVPLSSGKDSTMLPKHRERNAPSLCVRAAGA